MFKILKAQQGGQLTLETGFEMPTVDATNTPGRCLKFCQMRRWKNGIPATTRPVFSFLSIPLPSFSTSSIASWTTLPIFRVGPEKLLIRELAKQD